MPGPVSRRKSEGHCRKAPPSSFIKQRGKRHAGLQETRGLEAARDPQSANHEQGVPPLRGHTSRAVLEDALPVCCAFGTSMRTTASGQAPKRSHYETAVE